MNKIVKYIVIGLIMILIAVGIIGLIKKSNNTIIPEEENVITKTIKHKHYEYEIPETWNYSEEELYFELTNPSEKGWHATIMMVYDADNYLFERYGVVTKDLRKEGYNFAEPEIKKIDGHEYLLYYTSIANEEGGVDSRLIGFVCSGGRYTYKIELSSDIEEYDLNTFLKISKILLAGKHDNTDTKYYYFSYEYAES